MAALTQNLGAGILFIGALTQTGANVTVPAGGFRFANTTYVYLPYQTGIFGFTAQQVIAVSGNGYIVARYSVTPTVSNATNYSFPTSYYFVTTPLSTDCVVCTITAGNISDYGNFLINTAASQVEVNNGTITSKAVVPKTLAGILATYTNTTVLNALLALKAPLNSPAITGIGTCPTAALGTNTTQLANCAFVATGIANNSLGINQTPQDVTSSRAIGVTYTNTTSKPIEVSILATFTNGVNGQPFLFVDGVVFSGANNLDIGIVLTLQAIVPAGSTYRYQVSAGSAGFSFWSELR